MSLASENPLGNDRLGDLVSLIQSAVDSKTPVPETIVQLQAEANGYSDKELWSTSFVSALWIIGTQVSLSEAY